MFEQETKTRAELRRERTREEILDAAWALCAANGLGGLSLRELATAVGMRAPSLYSYFESKDAIFDAMFGQGQVAFAARIGPILHRPLTGTTLFDGAEAMFEFCLASHARYQLLFQRVVPDFEPSPEAYAPAVQVIEDMAAQFRRAGIDASGALDLWTALVTGLIDQQISNDPGGDRWRRLLPEAVAMFCDRFDIPTD